MADRSEIKLSLSGCIRTKTKDPAVYLLGKQSLPPEQSEESGFP